MSTSVASTALIYHFTKPYTVNLYYHPEPSPNPKGPLVTFETLSLFGNPVFTTVRAGQLGATTRPFTTFKVADKTGVQPPETPNGQLEYRKALEGFVEKMAKRPWKAREYFYLLEDRGVGNEVEGREKEFDEVMTAAGRRKAD